MSKQMRVLERWRELFTRPDRTRPQTGRL